MSCTNIVTGVTLQWRTLSVLICDWESKTEYTFLFIKGKKSGMGICFVGRSLWLIQKETRKIGGHRSNAFIVLSCIPTLGNSINVTRLLLRLIFNFTTAIVLHICRWCRSMQRVLIHLTKLTFKTSHLFLREGIGHVTTKWFKVYLSIL